MPFHKIKVGGTIRKFSFQFNSSEHERSSFSTVSENIDLFARAFLPLIMIVPEYEKKVIQSARNLHHGGEDFEFYTSQEGMHSINHLKFNRLLFKHNCGLRPRLRVPLIVHNIALSLFCMIPRGLETFVFLYEGVYFFQAQYIVQNKGRDFFLGIGNTTHSLGRSLCILSTYHTLEELEHFRASWHAYNLGVPFLQRVLLLPLCWSLFIIYLFCVETCGAVVAGQTFGIRCLIPSLKLVPFRVCVRSYSTSLSCFCSLTGLYPTDDAVTSLVRLHGMKLSRNGVDLGPELSGDIVFA